MFDLVAAIVLTAVAFSLTGAIFLSTSAGAADRRRVAGWIAAWFVVVVALTTAGVFSAGGLGIIAIGVAVTAALAALVIGASRSTALRNVVAGVPLPWLTGVHVGRLLGILFVLLYASGRLPATFALTAGLGDILVALAAIPVTWMVLRHSSGWRSVGLVWNAVGLLDLVTAVALGVGSAPGSPLRFIYETPANDAMGTLPWFLIPGFLVPLYIGSHLAIFARLAEPAWRRAAHPIGAPAGRGA